jgi:hypothetical protein
MLGIPIPESFDGASVLAWSEGEPPPRDRLLFAELVPDRKVPRRIVTAIDGDWQLIVDFRLGARELYDLARDPTAQRNRVTDAPDRARDLEAALRRHMALRVGPLRISRKADESP